MNTPGRIVYSTQSTESYTPTSDDYRLKRRARAARIAEQQRQARRTEQRFPRPEIVNAMNGWCKNNSHRHVLNNRYLADLEEDKGY